MALGEIWSIYNDLSGRGRKKELEQYKAKLAAEQAAQQANEKFRLGLTTAEEKRKEAEGMSALGETVAPPQIFRPGYGDVRAAQMAAKAAPFMTSAVNAQQGAGALPWAKQYGGIKTQGLMAQSSADKARADWDKAELGAMNPIKIGASKEAAANANFYDAIRRGEYARGATPGARELGEADTEHGLVGAQLGTRTGQSLMDRNIPEAEAGARLTTAQSDTLSPEDAQARANSKFQKDQAVDAATAAEAGKQQLLTTALMDFTKTNPITNQDALDMALAHQMGLPNPPSGPEALVTPRVSPTGRQIANPYIRPPGPGLGANGVDSMRAQYDAINDALVRAKNLRPNP